MASPNAPNTTLLQNVVWISSPVILLATVYFMRLRGRTRTFPFFVLYLAWVAAKTWGMFPVGYFWGFKSWTAFYTSYAVNAFAIGLSFMALYEVLSNVLTAGTFFVKPSTFLMVNILLLTAGTALTLMAGHRYNITAFVNSFVLVEVLLRYVMIAVLIILGVLTVFFGYYWANNAFGIALGFGFYAAMVIVNSELYGRMGLKYFHIYSVVDVLAYTAASCIWLIYAVKERPEPPSLPPTGKISELEKSVEAIKK